MLKKSFPLSKVYRLLEAGPVAMITTAWKGKTNIMTNSWHMMMDFEPPMVACIVSDQCFTFELLKASKECVLNIPTVELAKKAVGCGNVSGRKVDKFEAFHLTPVVASRVKAPLIDECYVNLECKVIDSKMAKKYNLFVLEVVKAWIEPSKRNPKTIHHLGKGTLMVAGRTMEVPSHMK